MFLIWISKINMFLQKYDITILFLCFSLIIIGNAFTSARKPLPEKRSFAIYTPIPPKIDGKVDRVWLKAPANGGFLQHSPEQGLPATNDTRFFVLYDDKNIYFLFIMLDRDLRSIPARLVDRDYEFYPDDCINFYLDTYNDHRRAYFFSTNPLGVEQDGLISENGENVDLTWDGIFEVAARINKYGWVAEFAIPYKTLRFRDNLKYQIWGFNVWRVRKKNREISFWSLVDQNYRIYRLDKGGVLIGMKNVSSGQHVYFLPYTTVSQVYSEDKEVEFKTGIDIKYNPSSDITLDLTLNPDFGQVEIDEEKINLDKRLEIFLEEKRPFFLENTNLFQLPFYQLFYSRRIGAQSNIKGGAKLTGKVGSYSFGVLEALTGDWRNAGFGDPGIPPDDELFSVIRVQRDIFHSSNLGVMLADREENLGDSLHQSNRVGGVDWTIYSGQEYFIGQVAYSTNSKDHTRGVAAYSQIGHYDQLFWFDLHALHFDPDFDINGTGFFQKIPGKGQKEIGFYVDIHPLINTLWLRSWGVSIAPTIFQDSDETRPSWGIQSSLWLEAPDQSHIKFGYTRYRSVENDIFSFSRAPHELSYWGRDIFMDFQSDPGKTVSFRLRWNFDSQYYFQTHSVGFNKGIESAIRVKPLSNAFFEIGLKWRWFLDDQLEQMPAEDVGQSDVRIWTLRGRYLFTKNIFARGFLQYTTGAENIAT